MKRNAPRVNNPARLARLRNQAIKLRERVKRSTLAFHERTQARFTWWQRAYRVPMVADWEIFTRAKTLLSAFMALLGLASSKKSSLVALMVEGPVVQASRLQPRSLDIRGSRKPEMRNTNRNRRRLYTEGLEQRQLLAAVLGTGTGALVGNDLTDLGNNGVEASYNAPSNLAGFDGVFFSNLKPNFGSYQAAFNVFDNRAGGAGDDKALWGFPATVDQSQPQIVGANFATTHGPRVLTSFTITSAEDTPERDPTRWKIEGSNDTTTGLNGTWTTIYDKAVGGSDWTQRQQVNRYSPADGDAFLTSQPFTAFRMVTTATGFWTMGTAQTVFRNDIFQLSEIEFFGVPGNDVVVTVPVNLADIVGGGNGAGTGAVQGINQVTGLVVTSANSSPILGSNVKNVYSSVAHAFIDGVFVPDGGPTRTTPIIVSTTGVTVTGIGDSVNDSWDYIWNGRNSGTSMLHPTTTRIGFHANKGITFDLQAIENANPGYGVTSFSALEAVEVTSGSNGVEFAVVVDGIIRQQRILLSNGSQTITLPINPNDRFLTLIATDNGGWGSDHAIFGDPILTLTRLNAPPTVATNVVAVSANEGGTASNAGTFSDAQGNATVTITASIGTIAQNNGAGTWSWSLNAADGPAGPFTVTITATDNQAAAANTTFTYAVNNVPPTISLSGNATVNEGSPYTLNLGVVTDPGQDTIQSYSINWGDGVIDSFTGNPAHTTATHTFADGPATQTNNVTVTDEDGGFLGGSLSVQVLNVAPTVTGGALSLSENSGNGTVVGSASASDPGADTFSFAITGGNTSSAFAIQATTGQITVANSVALDFETAPVFNLTVAATDSDGAVGTAAEEHYVVESLSVAALGGVTAAQIAAMPDNVLSAMTVHSAQKLLSGLTPAAIAAFTGPQISFIPTAVFAGLNAAEEHYVVESLSVAALGGVTAAQIAAMPDNVLSAMTVHSAQKLLSGLTPAAVAAFTGPQISSIPTAVFAGLNAAEEHYVVESLSVAALGGVTAAQIAAMPDNVLSAMTVHSAQKLLSGLTPAAIAAFTGPQISSIPTSVFAGLSAAEEHYVVESLSVAALGGVTAAQIAAMPDNVLSAMTVHSAQKLLSGLTPAAIAAFTGPQISFIPTAVFAGLNAVEEHYVVESLSVAALGGVTAAQIAAMPDNVLSAMTVHSAQKLLSGLTPAAIAAFTGPQISFIPTAVFAGLNAAEEHYVVESLSVAALGGVTAAQIAAMPDNVLSAMTVHSAQKLLSGLTPAAIAAFTGPQISSIPTSVFAGLSAAEEHYVVESLSVAALGGVTAAQIAAMPDNVLSAMTVHSAQKLLSGLTPAAIAAFTGPQISFIPTAVFAGLNAAEEHYVVESLSVAALGGVTAAQIAAMPDNVLSAMTVHSAQKLLSGLTPAAIAAFTGPQISSIPTSVFAGLSAAEEHYVVESLSVAALGGVTAAQIAAMPDNVLSAMTVHSAQKLLSGLSPAAIAAFTGPQISSIPTSVFAGLSAAEEHYVVESLSVAALGGVTAAQIAAMPDDVLSAMTVDSAEKLFGSLSPDAFAAFTVAQISQIPAAVLASFAARIPSDTKNLTETNTAASISSFGTLTSSDTSATFGVQSQTAGTFGTFSIDSAGAWTYTANSAHDEFVAGETYTDKFTVIATVGATAVTINILGTNETPSVSNAGDVTVNEGQSANNSGAWSDADLGDDVTLTASLGSVTKNTNGTWSWSSNAVDGTGVPTIVTITATDSQHVVANSSFTYTINNVAPTISRSGNATVDEGSPYSLNLGVVTDPGTDTVTAYSINWGDGPAENFTGNPSNTIATHTYADGPNAYTITVTLTDEDGTVTGGSLSVIALNVAPTAADDAIALLENDSAQVVNVLANDSDPAGANDPLSITSVNTTGTVGAVTLNSGQVSYSPDGFFEALGAGETTLDTFEYLISDGDGGTDTAIVTVTVTGQNDAPTATGTLPNVSVNQNAANSVISLTGLFADVDANDTLSITAVSSSNGLVTAGVSGSSLTLDYQANRSGTATITLTATDGSGASVSLTFNVAVVSPAQQGNAIILLIQQWKDAGKINDGVAHSMIVKVENALKTYDKGNITAAGNQLNALKNEISAKVKPGALTLADATLAMSLIEALYDSMTP